MKITENQNWSPLFLCKIVIISIVIIVLNDDNEGNCNDDGKPVHNPAEWDMCKTSSRGGRTPDFFPVMNFQDLDDLICDLDDNDGYLDGDLKGGVGAAHVPLGGRTTPFYLEKVWIIISINIGIIS